MVAGPLFNAGVDEWWQGRFSVRIRWSTLCADICVGRAVELQPRIWFTLLFLLIPLRGFIQIENMTIKVWIFTFLGYLLLGLSYLFVKKLQRIKRKLVGCCFIDDIHASFLRSSMPLCVQTGVPFPSPNLQSSEPQVYEAVRMAGVKWLEKQEPPYKTSARPVMSLSKCLALPAQRCAESGTVG